MAQLPTIREIALDLYTDADIDYTTFDGQASGGSDDYQGYVNCLVSRYAIKYTKGDLELTIAEVIGSIPDEDGDATDEEHTLDHLYSIEEAGEIIKQGGTDSPQELISVIKNFMA